MKTLHYLVAAGVLLTGMGSCGIFETREPEQPSVSSCFAFPQTRPAIVLANLQAAIAQKCVDNYAACFAGPGNSERQFEFVPSTEGREQYGAAFDDWSASDELAYFRNLVAKATPNGFTSLVFMPRDSIITADSVVYTIDYTMTFEHTEPPFPIIARGNLQFSLAANANNVWSIYRWTDFKSTSDITWSLFKGKFSN